MTLLHPELCRSRGLPVMAPEPRRRWSRSKVRQHPKRKVTTLLTVPPKILVRYGGKSQLSCYVLVVLLRRYFSVSGANQTMPSGSLLVGLAVVARDFDMSQGEIAWISTAGSISTGSFLLLGGRLADLHGRKRLLVASYAYCAIWSIVAGFANNKYPLSRVIDLDIYF